MNLIGPLPESDGYKHCVTIIDRFSRWPVAIPLKDTEVITVARAFYDNWVANFGAAKTITTDQGSQFEAQFFTALLQLIGCQRIRITAYHSASNSLRTHVRLDTGTSPAEFVYGMTLRVPGEFILPDDFTPSPQIFIEEFREHMRKVKPISIEHKHKKRAFVFKDLHSCSHVFLRVAVPRVPIVRNLEKIGITEKLSVSELCGSVAGQKSTNSQERPGLNLR
ncbi:PREDICTED: uncharacterized protein LOC105149507 [Acromyrmex echinatior]|uniref:uncharacterized protein LOC105149507 n=1 Tax=Acromyrmex echinatior TaxID=103372 RepID=UPI000580D36F|nr:PREDICTED: uncharacterized protein LOC105149507 [Acromyrmex echinatior]